MRSSPGVSLKEWIVILDVVLVFVATEATGHKLFGKMKTIKSHHYRATLQRNALVPLIKLQMH